MPIETIMQLSSVIILLFILAGLVYGIVSRSSRRGSLQTSAREYLRLLAERSNTYYMLGDRQRLSLEHMYLALPLLTENESFGSLEKGLARSRRLLLLGEAGSGKSTLLREFFIRQWREVLKNGKSEYFPILVELSKFVSAREYVGLGKLDDVVGVEVTKSEDPYARTDFFEFLLSTPKKFGQLLVCLDGLDELGTDERLEEVAQMVDDFARRHPEIAIIITSRYVQAVRPELFQESFAVVRMSPLSTENVTEYVRKLYSERDPRSVQLLKLVQEKSHGDFQTLISTPLLLSVLAVSYQDVEGSWKLDPPTLTRLVRSCIDAVSQRWHQSMKATTHGSTLGQMNLEVLESVLKKIAENFLHGNQISGSVPYETAQRCAADVLDYYRRRPEFRPPANPHAMLQQIEFGTSLLHGGQSSANVVFHHELFRDYFISLNAIDNPALAEKLFENVHIPVWENVVIFYAGLASDTSRLLKAVYSVKEMDARRKLIGKCISQRPRIDAASIDEKLVSLLIDLRLDQDYHTSFAFISQLFEKLDNNRLNLVKHQILERVKSLVRDDKFEEATVALGALDGVRPQLRLTDADLEILRTIISKEPPTPPLAVLQQKCQELLESIQADKTVQMQRIKLPSSEYFVRSFDEIPEFQLNILGERAAPLRSLEKLVDVFFETTHRKIEVLRYDLEDETLKNRVGPPGCPYRITVWEGDSTDVTREASEDYLKKGGRFDLILQPHVKLGELASRNIIMPIGPIRERLKYANSSVEPFRDFRIYEYTSVYGGKEYGYPFTSQSMLLWYRRDLMMDESLRKEFESNQPGQRLQVPRTWNEYRQLACFITNSERAKATSAHMFPAADRIYGTTLQGKTGHPSVWYEWLQVARSFGGGVIRSPYGKEYGDLIINSPDTIEGTEFYRSLLDCSPKDCLNWDWYDAKEAFVRGKIFMALLWNDQAFEAINDLGDRKSTLGFALPPKGKEGIQTHIESWNCFIPTFSRQPELALLFMEWLMDERVQLSYQKNGGLSARISLYEDTMLSQFEELPYIKVSREAFKWGFASPVIPEGPQVQAETISTLNQILNGGEIKISLDKLAKKLLYLLKNKSKLPTSIRESE